MLMAIAIIQRLNSWHKPLINNIRVSVPVISLYYPLGPISHRFHNPTGFVYVCQGNQGKVDLWKVIEVLRADSPIRIPT